MEKQKDELARSMDHMKVLKKWLFFEKYILGLFFAHLIFLSFVVYSKFYYLYSIYKIDCFVLIVLKKVSSVIAKFGCSHGEEIAFGCPFFSFVFFFFYLEIRCSSSTWRTLVLSSMDCCTIDGLDCVWNAVVVSFSNCMDCRLGRKNWFHCFLIFIIG